MQSLGIGVHIFNNFLHKNSDVIHLRNKLTGIERKKAKQIPVKKRIKPAMTGYAAIIAVFILVGTILIFNGRNLTGDEIIDRYYESYEITTPTRSQQVILNSDYSTAIEYYNIRDYNNAALYFNKVPEDDTKYMESLMLYGVSSFETENYIRKSNYHSVKFPIMMIICFWRMQNGTWPCVTLKPENPGKLLKN